MTGQSGVLVRIQRCELQVAQGFGRPPPSLLSPPSCLSAVIRGVTTKELYPEFGLDVND